MAPKNIPKNPGSWAYEETMSDAIPPSEKPDEDPRSPPKGPVAAAEDAEEDPPRSELRIPESPDADEVDAPGDARFCSVVGIEETSCDSVDCTPAPVDVPATWAPVAPCASNPAALVVCGAAVNGVTFAVAAAEFAA